MARVSSNKGIFALCVCLAGLLWSTSAAPAVPLELEWIAPENECPTQAVLVEQVAQLVEHHPTSAYPVRASAHVERLAAERYRVLLSTESQGTRGSRRLRRARCAHGARRAWQATAAGAELYPPGRVAILAPDHHRASARVSPARRTSAAR